MHKNSQKGPLLKRINPSMLNHGIITSNKPNFSPCNFVKKNKESTSTSPRRECLTPRKDKHKKSASKLFQKARSNDYGETYLATSNSNFEYFTSSNKYPSYR